MYFPVLITVIILTIAFLIGSAFIFRHLRHYGYLSPHFKITVSVFAFLAVALLSTAFYFLLQLGAVERGSEILTPSVSGGVTF